MRRHPMQALTPPGGTGAIGRAVSYEGTFWCIDAPTQLVGKGAQPGASHIVEHSSNHPLDAGR